jgi:hypothetical protein
MPAQGRQMKTNNKMEKEKEIPSAQASMIERRNQSLYNGRRPFEMSYWEMSLIEGALEDSMHRWNERINTLPPDKEHELRLSLTECYLFREALHKRIVELKTNEFLTNPLPF